MRNKGRPFTRLFGGKHSNIRGEGGLLNSQNLFYTKMTQNKTLKRMDVLGEGILVTSPWWDDSEPFKTGCIGWGWCSIGNLSYKGEKYILTFCKKRSLTTNLKKGGVKPNQPTNQHLFLVVICYILWFLDPWVHPRKTINISSTKEILPSHISNWAAPFPNKDFGNEMFFVCWGWACTIGNLSQKKAPPIFASNPQ